MQGESFTCHFRHHYAGLIAATFSGTQNICHPERTQNSAVGKFQLHIKRSRSACKAVIGHGKSDRHLFAGKSRRRCDRTDGQIRFVDVGDVEIGNTSGVAFCHGSHDNLSHFVRITVVSGGNINRHSVLSVGKDNTFLSELQNGISGGQKDLLGT